MRPLRFASVLSCCFALFCLTSFGNPLGEIKGYGSAFFISPYGHLLSAQHVVDGDGHVTIVYNGQHYPAEILGLDAEHDLALLKIEARNTPYLTMCNPNGVKVGQDVLATGYPNPGIQGNDVKLTDGMVNCLSGVYGSKNQIQTSAPIQPGNSGGPLVNRETGEVLGVIVSTLKHQPRTGSIPQCVNYAIKWQLALPLMSPHGRFGYSKPNGGPIERVLAATVQVMKTEFSAGTSIEGQLSELIYSYFDGDQTWSMFSPRLEMFFKDLDVPRERVIASLAQHKSAWSTRSFKVKNYEIHKFDQTLFGMSVDYSYELKNGSTKNAGNASILFKIKRDGDTFRIASIEERERQNSQPRNKRKYSPYSVVKN